MTRLHEASLTAASPPRHSSVPPAPPLSLRRSLPARAAGEEAERAGPSSRAPPTPQPPPPANCQGAGPGRAAIKGPASRCCRSAACPVPALGSHSAGGRTYSAMMSFSGAEALLGAPFAPLHGGGSLHYALARKGGARSAAGSSSGFHSWARTSVSSVSAAPARFRGAAATSSTDSLDTLSNGPEGCVVAAAAARSEKEQLQALNDRFAGYIDKVRQLEAHNRSLEGEAAALRQQHAGRAAMGELYEREVREMRGAVLRLGAARGQLRLEQEHLLEDIAHVRQRLDDEARQREEAEAAARALARFAQEAEAARVDLQKKAQALQEECGYLRRHHQEEVGELLGQIQGCGAAQAQVQAEARDALKCDVTSALREIRAQLEGHAVHSTLQSEEWFRG